MTVIGTFTAVHDFGFMAIPKAEILAQSIVNEIYGHFLNMVKISAINNNYKYFIKN